MNTSFLINMTLLLAFIGIVVAFIFFLLTQQRTLRAVRSQDRLMRSGLVWLQLIPLFGLVWQFVVATRIADSIRKERISRLTDNLLTDHSGPAALGAARPTLGIGLTYSICTVCCTISDCCNLFATPPDHVMAQASTTEVVVAFLVFFFTLASFVCWIIYWVSLARIRRQLVRQTA